VGGSSVLVSSAAPPAPRTHALSLHDALPIWVLVIGLNTTSPLRHKDGKVTEAQMARVEQQLARAKEGQIRILVAHHPFDVILTRSEEHTSELQSRENLVCRLLLEKKNRID